MSSPRVVSERAVVFLIGAVQFINVLDFIMVTPLGPHFAAGLGIAPSHMGVIASGYTLPACVAGVAGSYFLDRFDRRKALAVAMLGLVAGTAAGGFATGLTSLLMARAVAGLFGGPATSLSMSIIADLIPVERRGRAMGAVMGAFSVASVLGIPLALMLAQWGNWRMPFLAVSVLGVLVVAGAIFYLPPIRGHLERQRGPVVSARDLFIRGDVLLSYTMTFLTNMAGFVIIVNLPVYVQHNLGYPPQTLNHIYLVGGVVSFVTLRMAGRAVDRLGSFRVGSVGVAFFIATLYVTFIQLPAGVPLVAIFAFFFMSNGVRNVAYSTLTSRVPEPAIRARFQSFQSAVQHLGASAGSLLSSALLTSLPGGLLGGIPHVVGVSVLASLTLPVMFFLVERRLQARDQALVVPMAAVPAVAVSPGGGAPRS
ncbi:MFS transporter [Archangium sp.]|uniref:MFS transporter n=1 Tax=Archangium sp. TaxID=1872627 RepID=UPI003899D116